MKRLLVSLTIALTGAAALAAAPAVAAPIWHLDVHHNETHFPPGGDAQYWLDVANVSNDPSSGAVTATLKLPAGIKGKLVKPSDWSCPSVAGSASIVCTYSAPIARHSIESSLVIAVTVHPEASGMRFATAEVKGGGAAKSVTAVEPTWISSTPAGFGIVEESFVSDFFEADAATPVRRAGAHPELFVTAFDFNTVSEPTAVKPEQKVEAESIRNLEVDLPPGFYGDPTAVGECTPAQLSFGACPRSSQVGRADLRIYPIAAEESRSLSVAVFNMEHPRGSIADLAFTFTGIPVHITASLDPARRYTITTDVFDINESLPPFHQKLTLWGVPADPSHDSERCLQGENIKTASSCPTDFRPRPFLTAPFDCEADNVVRLHHYESWQSDGVFGTDLEYVQPGKTTDCDKPRFEPAVDVHPTGSEANTPTGLDVEILVPQNDNPDAPATPPVKRVQVSLPEGMSFSPSFADGLQSCSLAQIGLGNDQPIQCPDNSRIGEVTLSTPLLPEALEGSMYLAAQGDNPFGSLFALYLVLRDTEERGVLVKIPGRIDVDQVTGRIVTTFDETPQFPFDAFTLKFRSGSRAPLVSPPTCGIHTIGVEVTSWAQPHSPVDVSNSYAINEGPSGTPCHNDSAARPFGPAFRAGTVNPVAGEFSPFALRLSRSDHEQELAGLTTVLPPGLTAKLAGITPCPDAAIASISTAPGAGAAESASPACPPASQIGTISAGLGAGPGPNYFPGRVFLAGPYKGAPISLAVIAPGLAGPFDLGNVIVRVPVRIDPTTTQATAVSDPFPTILQGVILRVRDVRFHIDRAETMINPTNCSRMSINGLASGLAGGVFSTSVPFGVGECAALPFKPKLAMRLIGATNRGAHPKLRATLTMPAKGANIRRASVALPASEFLDQSHIGTICTRVQFAAEQCPAASVYGTASARTPLLDAPVEGPVYLRSSDNPLPDLVARLKGPASQPIEVHLVGRIDSVRNGIRTTFDVVPDAPVSSFTLQMAGGKKGLLVHSTNICKGTHRLTAKFVGQNGKATTLRPKVQNSCKKKRKNQRRAKRG